MKAFLPLIFFIGASSFAGMVDDSDLSHSIMAPMSVPSLLKPTDVTLEKAATGETRFYTFIEKDGVSKEIYSIPFAASVNCKTKAVGTPVTFNAELATNKYKITSQRGLPYSMSFNGQCGYTHKVTFKSTTNEGQAATVMNVAYKSILKFEGVGIKDYWGHQMQFVWPASGDFYNGRVNVTRGDHWDVVGHELGHAVYFENNIGRSGGGQHKIDECYTHALALSEGWASFFAAWVLVKIDDPHAQFEFMVPRRAPLAIEHVPADVCKGPTNEWRVYAFLWDIIDRNDDGEVSELEFEVYWAAVRDQKVSNIQFHAELLIDAGLMAKDQMNEIWAQNFLEAGPF